MLQCSCSTSNPLVSLELLFLGMLSLQGSATLRNKKKMEKKFKSKAPKAGRCGVSGINMRSFRVRG